MNTVADAIAYWDKKVKELKADIEKSLVPEDGPQQRPAHFTSISEPLQKFCKTTTWKESDDAAAVSAQSMFQHLWDNGKNEATMVAAAVIVLAYCCFRWKLSSAMDLTDIVPEPTKPLVGLEVQSRFSRADAVVFLHEDKQYPLEFKYEDLGNSNPKDYHIAQLMLHIYGANFNDKGEPRNQVLQPNGLLVYKDSSYLIQLTGVDANMKLTNYSWRKLTAKNPAGGAQSKFNDIQEHLKFLVEVDSIASTNVHSGQSNLVCRKEDEGKVEERFDAMLKGLASFVEG